MTFPDWLSKNKLYQAIINTEKKNDDSDNFHELLDRHEVSTVEEANLIGSKWIEGEHELHKIFLDIDVEHVYRESRTEGHAHLLLNLNITKDELEILYSIFVKLGITGQGNYRQITDDGQLFLRL